MLNFSTREISGVLVIAFETAEDLLPDWQSTGRDQLYREIEGRQNGRVAIDLSEVNYLASSEIGFLVTIKRRIERRNGRLAIFGVSPYLLDIFKTMNLVKLLEIVPDLKSALARLRMEGGTPESAT